MASQLRARPPVCVAPAVCARALAAGARASLRGPRCAKGGGLGPPSLSDGKVAMVSIIRFPCASRLKWGVVGSSGSALRERHFLASWPVW